MPHGMRSNSSKLSGTFAPSFIGGLAGAIGGMLFPFVTGCLLDAFKATGDVTGGYAILFGVCASAYLLSFGLNHLLAPRFEPIPMKEP